MSVGQGFFTISVDANADLSADQYYFGSINSSAKVALTGAGLAADGVIMNKPDASGRSCALATAPGYVVPVAAGAAFANGALLEVDGTGRAITQSSGKIVGKALAAATAAGDVVSALLILQR